MARFSQIEGVIRLKVQEHVAAALAQYGQNLAAAAQAECPVDTGKLRSSIQWQSTGDLSGQLAFESYGLLVNNGHKVASSTKVITATDVRGRTTTRRAYIKVTAPGGYLRIKRIPANPFLLRAAARASAHTPEPYATAFYNATVAAITHASLSPRQRAKMAKQGFSGS